jgi:hypothetical protein
MREANLPKNKEELFNAKLVVGGSEARVVWLSTDVYLP